MTIYLDHQASTPTNQDVIDVMQPLWRENFGNPHSSEHIVGWKANSLIENSKSLIANVIDSEPDEIFFYSGATEANNHSIFALSALSTKQTDRKRVIVTEIEHKCVLEASKFWAKTFNLDLCFLKVNEEGFIDFEQLAELLKVPTLFCSIMYVNNEVGVIQDLEKISTILRNSEAYFHSDCAQAFNAITLNTISEYVDIGTFSGHKIGGPQGIGCSYISADVQELLEPHIFGGGQQGGLRSGTLPLPLVVGLGEAYKTALDDNKSSTKKGLLLKNNRQLWELLKQNLPNIELNGPDLNTRHPGNLNVYFPNVRASNLLQAIQPDVCASSGSACSSGSIDASYVLTALGHDKSRAESSIRFSVSAETSSSDLQTATKLISAKYLELSANEI
jgi:cysteine desulfurase